MRRTPRPSPFNTPYRATASAAYSEQVGVNRQAGGRIGESAYLKIRRRRITTRSIRVPASCPQQVLPVFFQRTGEGGDQIVHVGFDHGRSGVDDYIASDAGQDWESRTSRNFAEAPFTAIPDYSGPDLLRDSYAEAQLLAWCLQNEEREEWRMQSYAPIVYEPKFAARAKRLERLARCHQTTGLNSDSASSACDPWRDASSAQDGLPSCSCAHESHASWRGGDCWAGMYASLE